MTSRKDSAKRFKKWVTGTVLPSIRKTGAYGVAPVIDLSDPAFLRSTLLTYTEKVIALESKVTEQAEQIAVVQPKAEALDRLEASTGSIIPRDAAKTLKIPPSRIYSVLAAEGWVFRSRGSWEAYSHVINRGYLEHRAIAIPGDGEDRFRSQVMITAAGVAHLAKRLASARKEVA